jgi:uncharacterized protein
MDKLCRLMPPDPSQLIEPLRLAKAGKRLNGQFRLDVFHRLDTLLNNDLGVLVYRLDFAEDPKGIYCVNGEIDASVEVLCQRCLKPFQLYVNHSVNLGIVLDKAEAKQLPSEYEPLVLNEDTLSLVELVEDELILALPISPVHAPEDCLGSDILEKMNHEQKRHPFDELAKLKLHKQT